MQLEAGALSVGVAGASLPAPRRAWRRTRVLLASGGARIGAAILLLVAVCAIAPGWLAPADPNEQNLLARFTRPASRSAISSPVVPTAPSMNIRAVMIRLLPVEQG